MKILVADALAKEAVDKLKEKHEVDEIKVSPEELLESIAGYDAVIVRSRSKITADVIEAGVNLKVIGRAGIGVDNIAVDKASEKKIPVVNAPRGSTLSVAELAMGFIISLARGIPNAHASMKSGKWEKKKFKGLELDGKTLGFIGSGRIGAEVASRAHAFNMKTISYDPYLPQEVADQCGIMLVDYDTVLKESDFISIHALLTDETRGMVGPAEFEKMKTSAFIINCARGGIIDEAALYTALKDGKIAGAALDVFENEPPENSPLMELDNIIFSPHIGASTVEAQIKAGVTTAEQVMKVLNGEKPDFTVNPLE